MSWIAAGLVLLAAAFLWMTGKPGPGDVEHARESIETRVQRSERSPAAHQAGAAVPLTPGDESVITRDSGDVAPGEPMHPDAQGAPVPRFSAKQQANRLHLAKHREECIASRPATYPLVYESGNRAMMTGVANPVAAGAVNPSLSPVIEKEQARFEAEAGAGELEEADPDYARRWKRAGTDADDRFRSLFGWEAYAARQREASMREAAGEDSVPTDGQ
ncbi:hypothetical protein [Luteolibacter sp. LG18]|uniref:hypothetical protein n=1 Tax=Luteolibacter sp. LG18 TaxID=2819286 RepID=UPI0030C6DC48